MGNEVEVRLSDVGFDVLFRKSNIVVCLILYVFNKQRPYCLLWWVTRRSLLSCEGDVLHAQDGERAAHPHRVQGLLHCAEAGGLQHPEYCSPGHLRDLCGGFFNNVFSCELSPGGSCCIQLIVEDNLHPP